MKKYIYWICVALSITVFVVANYCIYFLYKWDQQKQFFFIIIIIIDLCVLLGLVLIEWKKAHKVTLNITQVDDENPITIATQTEKKANKKSYFGDIHEQETDNLPKHKKIDVNYEIKYGILFFNVPKLLEDKSDDSAFVQKYGSEIIMWVSDGASTSLYSWLWWRSILKYFSKTLYKHTDSKNKFLEALTKFVDIEGKERSRLMQAKKLPWHAYAKLSKWSDASLTWLYIKWDMLYYAIIWDSPLIIISPKDKQVFFYPYENSADFSQNPILINTDNTQNEKMKESLIMGTRKLNNNEKVIVCSDGIGKFLLSVYEKNRDEFLKVIDIILAAKNPISNVITDFKNKWHHFGDEKVVMKDDDTSFIYFTYKKKFFPW